MAEQQAVAKIKKNKPGRDIWRRLCRNKMAVAGLCTIIVIIILALLAPYILPYDYAAQDYDAALQFPNKDHLLGTDNFGRDIFSRILFGSRYTLVIGFGCVTAACVVGTFLGVIAGFYRKLDNLIMRFIDLLIGLPHFMLALCIIAVMGTGLKNMMIALAITTIPVFARVARAQVLQLTSAEYIEAARCIGAGDARIIMRHILPNILSPIIVQYSLNVVIAILWGASFSFIGMGVQPPTPEWGLMISAGRTYLRSYWYMSIIPGLAIIITTYALNLLGDGLRDALDPRLKQ